MATSKGKDQNIHLRAAGVVQPCHKFLTPDKLRRNPIEDGAISGFSGQKSVPE